MCKREYGSALYHLLLQKLETMSCALHSVHPDRALLRQELARLQRVQS
jgi:hypothetical protein